MIPFKSSAKNRPMLFPKALYRARARIEQLVGKLKRFKRVALRCAKTVQNYGAFVALALGFILVKSVHTAYWVVCCEVWYSGEAILVLRGVLCRATRKISCARSLQMNARSWPA